MLPLASLAFSHSVAWPPLCCSSPVSSALKFYQVLSMYFCTPHSLILAFRSYIIKCSTPPDFPESGTPSCLLFARVSGCPFRLQPPPPPPISALCRQPVPPGTPQGSFDFFLSFFFKTKWDNLGSISMFIFVGLGSPPFQCLVYVHTLIVPVLALCFPLSYRQLSGGLFRIPTFQFAADDLSVSF